VLRLMTSSYLVDACTGRLTGFLPLRILTPVLVDDVGPLEHQAAGSDKLPFEVDSGPPVPCRKCDDQILMNGRQRSPSRSMSARMP